jgi:hypothetical protein
MTTMKRQGRRSVPDDSYYVVKIRPVESNVGSLLLRSAKMIFAQWKETFETNGPTIMYTYPGLVIFLFSSVDAPVDKECTCNGHWFGGDHQRICTELCSFFTLRLTSLTRCSLTEIPTRTKVIAYFHTKVYENGGGSFHKMTDNGMETRNDFMESAVENVNSGYHKFFFS